MKLNNIRGALLAAGIKQRTTFMAKPSAVALAVASMICVATAGAQEATPNFDIAAQPLVSALREFSAQAGRQVLFDEDTVAGRTAPAVQGRLAPRQALDQLLSGSHIQVVVSASGAYTLKRSADSAASPALPEIAVTSQATAAFQVKDAASQKFTAALIDTPRSVTVISSELMKETQATNVADALRKVPGITFKGGDAFGAPGGDRPAIRGFDAANSLFVDGMRSAGAQSRETFAVEQIDVVKGPSSVYSGRGAVGGSINIVSKTPKAEDFFNSSVGIGTDNYRRGTVDVNRTINDTTAARLNLMYHDADMPGRNVVNYSRWGVAPSLAFGLNTPTQVVLSYYHMQSDDMPDYSVPYVRGGGAPLSVPRSRFFGLLARDFLKNTSDIAQVEVKHRISDTLSLRNLTQYSKTRLDYLATNPQWSGSSGNILSLQAKSGIFDMESFANQTELTGKFNLGGFENSFTTGLELSRERGTRDTYYVRDKNGNNLRSGAPCTVTYNCTSYLSWDPTVAWTGSIARTEPAYPVLTTTTDTASLYAFDTIKLSPEWLINGGLRYDNYSTKAVDTLSISNSASFWNYQIGVVYKPVESLSFYTSLGTSSNPVGSDTGQGSDVIGTANTRLAPERSRNLEVGTKWDALEQRLSLTAAVFKSEKNNARISDGLGNTINAGVQSVQGIELGITGQLTSAWDIFAGYTYLDSKIKDGGPSHLNQGKVFPMTPKNGATLWTSYRVLPNLKVGAGATYVAKVYTNPANTNFVPSYTKFDAMASYTVSKNLELQLNLYNLSDKLYYDKSYPNYAAVAAGRSAVITANFKY